MLLFLALLAPANAADLLVGAAQPYATINDAVSAANSGDRILIEPGQYIESPFTVDGDDLTFEATGGVGTVTIQSTNFGSWMFLDNGATVTWLAADFDGQNFSRFCTLRGGSQLDLTDATIADGSTVFDGAGVRVQEGSTLVATRCTFSGNAATRGAAIFSEGSDTTVRESRFTGNNASSEGTVWCSGGTGTCIVSTSAFESNTAPEGAALWVDGATSATFERSTVCGTTSNRLMYFQDTTAAVTESIFYDNTGLSDALLRVDNNATATLLNNHFVGAGSSGQGQVAEVRGTATFTNNLIAFNDGSGSAVRATGGGSYTAEYNLFYQNTANHADAALSASNLVDVDPVLGAFTPGNCDFTTLEPDPQSPVVNAGDPSLFGPDGSRSDIGAFVDLFPIDVDGDGFTPDVDCNDADATIYPGATEIFCDGIDQDCDPNTRDDPNNDADSLTFCEGDCNDNNANATVMLDVYPDGDFDGFGRGDTPTSVCGLPNNGSLVNGDCNDQDPNVFPGATEIPGNGIDDNCDGDQTVDADGDGVPWGEDCNDKNANRFPGNEDIPDDGKDQDCDGYDAHRVLTGGAGLNCGGCSATGTTNAPWWALGLLLFIRRRETRS